MHGTMMNDTATHTGQTGAGFQGLLEIGIPPEPLPSPTGSIHVPQDFVAISTLPIRA